MALLNALSALDDVEVASGDPTTGVGILRRALEAPMRKIAENDYSNLGDTSTLADPSVVESLIESR